MYIGFATLSLTVFIPGDREMRQWPVPGKLAFSFGIFLIVVAWVLLVGYVYADAKRRGISDGDRVRVFNDRGELFLRAHVNGSVQPGVAGARLGWAKLSDGGLNINVLTSARLTDLGAGATFYSTLVEVERVDATSTVSKG